MAKRQPADEVIRRWAALPSRLRALTRGLSRSRLDARRSPSHMTVRETVHHLVEANLIASNMVIAAMARDGLHYDWTWVMPGGDWVRRMGYDRAAVGPAIATLAGLCRHVASLLEATPAGLDRSIRLNDSPGSRVYSKSVRAILGDEVEHARQHLSELPRPRRRSR